jgi:hypothetical protein
MKLTVSSITLQGTHAVLNGTVQSDITSTPGTPFNFPVSNEDVYSRVYEPGKTYDFNFGSTTDTTDTLAPGQQPIPA